MKRFLSLILIGAMMLTMASCGKSDGKDSGDSGDSGSTYAAQAIALPEEIDQISSFAVVDDHVYFSYDNITDETEENYTSESKLASINVDGGDFAQIPYETSASAYIKSMALDDDENIWLLKSTVAEDAEDTETYSLVKIDSTGAVLSDIDLSGIISSGSDGEGTMVQSMIIGKDGNIYLGVISFSENSYADSVIVLDSAGIELFSLQADSVDNFIQTRDGSILISVHEEGGYQLKEVDASAKDWGEAYSLDNYYNNVFTGIDYDLYLNDGTNLYGYNLKTEETTTVLNWLDSGVPSSYMYGIAALSDSKFIFSSDDVEAGTSPLMLLAPSDDEANSNKTKITLAAYSMDDSLRAKIVEFNNTNEEYEIAATDYSTYGSEDDWWAGLTKLSTEIAAGNIPDIMCLSDLPTEQYVKKGILEDLYPYMESDKELSRDNFLESIMSALETDGKLYEMASSFYINTVVGNSDKVGTEMGWTFADLLTLADTLPDDASMFGPYFTKDAFMSYMLYANSNEFVDQSAGKCSFDSEEFIQLLEFANTLPAEYDYDNDTNADEYQLISEGRQVLSFASVQDPQDIQMYTAMFDGKAAYIGFPVSEGVGNSISLSMSFGITSASEHKDVAWEFIRQFFTQEYQNSYADSRGWSLPTNKTSFDRAMEKSMEKELDADGNEISTNSIGWDSFMVELYASTQEDVDTTLDVINSASGLMRYDASLEKIVTEETTAFFAGSQSAERTAKIIQDRVTTYINE